MRCSLIVTTYNWPEALAASLHSAFRQVVLLDEIIVAHDGSGSDTRELIAGLATKSPVPLIHSWQEDLGFRAAMSRNRAIARSQSDYLVMIDGDMVLDPHFLADHMAFAAPGRFVQGSRVILDPIRSAWVKANPDHAPQWHQSGVANRINGLRLPWLARQVAASMPRSRATARLAFVRRRAWRRSRRRGRGCSRVLQGCFSRRRAWPSPWA